MEVYLLGVPPDHLVVTIDVDDTVRDLFSKAEKATGISKERMALMFNGMDLADHGLSAVLADLGLTAETTIVVQPFSLTDDEREKCLRYLDARIDHDQRPFLKDIQWHLGLCGAHDKEVVLRAVSVAGEELRYADPSLRGNKDVILAAVAQLGRSLQFALSFDREIVLRAVEEDGTSLQFAPPEFRTKRDIVLQAVANDAKALEYVPQPLREEPDVVLTAARAASNHLETFRIVEPTRDVAMEVLRSSPAHLKVFPLSLRSDCNVVKTAVSVDGLVLQYATDGPRGDREVVLAAVASNGMALRYAAAPLRADREIVRTACSSNPAASMFGATP